MTDKGTKSAGGPVYEVVWPLGRSASRSPFRFGSQISDLNGKTIGEVWNYRFKGDKMFPIIRETLRQRFLDVRFVEYDTFGDIHGPREREIVAALPELLRQHGVDAVIAGIGS